MIVPGFPRIAVDLAICGGRPVIVGTRLRVTDILEMLAGGARAAEIAADFPYVRDDDVIAALVTWRQSSSFEHACIEFVENGRAPH